MKFALFYEIPVPKPWNPDSELVAYRNTIEQAVAGERFGWDAFWTVEHHFLQEYSHCSNPEVLYGAIAALTERMRLGYGVRLMPQPYNHPVRTAESVAVLDLISNGRVDFGTGRSATRAELEGFGIDPGQTRADVAGGHRARGRMLDERRVRVLRPLLADAETKGAAQALQKPHPPIWGATTSEEGHRQVGELGLGLCSFAVGISPEEVGHKVDIYREAVAGCVEPLGAYVHNETATFTMALCSGDRATALDLARESFEWYPKVGARQIASVSEWMAERSEDLGSYSYAADMQQHSDDGSLDLLSLEYLIDANACVLGTPEECIEMCRRYQAADIDLLLCLVNPYNVPHEAVMETIELMGTQVIPKFAD